MKETDMYLRPVHTGAGEMKTLRDEFAMAALQGILADSEVKPRSIDDLSGWCYKVADAMLAARKGGQHD